MKSPYEYPRRILLATIGTSPAVLVETLWAMRTPENGGFVPTEIHCVTTAKGAKLIDQHLLTGDVLRDYVTEYDQQTMLSALTPDRIHVVENENGLLDDIQTESDNAAMANVITDLIRTFTEDDQAALHVSIAGGRKTMTFLGGYILSIFARPQDRLSHVLVDPRFEIPTFFFPPKKPQKIEVRSGEIASTNEAGIFLADVPFIRLGGFLKRNPIAGARTYSEVVAEAQKFFDPPELILDAPTQSMICQGTPIKLGPALFAFVVYFGQLLIDEDDVGAAARTYDEFTDPKEQAYLRDLEGRSGKDSFGDMDADERRSARNGRAISQSTFNSYQARLNGLLKETLGELAERYQLKTLRRDPKAIGFDLEPDQITIFRFCDDEGNTK